MNLLTVTLEFFTLLYLLLGQLSVALAINGSSSIEPTVETDWATIKGMRQNVLGRDIDVFLGIPFAKPPIGELRFKRPVKLEKYQNGVFNAQSFGPACAQLPYPSHNIWTSSEDCLMLNIWKPSSNNSIETLKPVFFHVFGSAFTDGSVTEDKHHGDVLASVGDIIVVTMNYRLGFLGFGYGGSEEMPGNMAMHDIIMAMEWVHDNIQRFAGDPNQVTLEGNCAGAMEASILFLSPLVPSKFYDKLYLMNGVSTPKTVTEDKDSALKKSKLIAEAVGCTGSNSSTLNEAEPLSAETIECLRGLNFTVIANASSIPEITSLLLWNPGPSFQPIQGTDLLPVASDILIEQGEPRRKVHILVGNDQNEDEEARNFVPTNKHQAYEFLGNYIQLHKLENMTHDDFDRIFNYYFKSIEEDDVFHLKEAVSAFVGDYFYHCPELLFAEKWTQQGKLVHGYINEYVMDGYTRKDRPYGSYHGDGTFLIFGIAFHEYDKFTDRDRQVSREMISIVGDFVKGEKLKWPPMLARKDGHVLPLRWSATEKMDPRLIRVDSKDKICHYWGKLMDLKLSF